VIPKLLESEHTRDSGAAGMSVAPDTHCRPPYKKHNPKRSNCRQKPGSSQKPITPSTYSSIVYVRGIVNRESRKKKKKEKKKKRKRKGKERKERKEKEKEKEQQSAQIVIHFKFRGPRALIGTLIPKQPDLNSTMIQCDTALCWVIVHNAESRLPCAPNAEA